MALPQDRTQIRPILRNAQADLNSATGVAILLAPPRGTTYAIRGVDGTNSTSGGTRFLHIAVLKDAKYYYLHTMRGIDARNFGFQTESTMPRNPDFIGCLDDPDESLVVKMNDVGTDLVSVDYEIHPQ